MVDVLKEPRSPNNIQDIYVGDEAIDKRGVLELTYPIFRGVDTNFEHIEKVFHYVFYNELKVNPEEHPVMITEPLLNPKANRERLVQLMFETFNVPACAVENSAKLTFFGSGASSGTVLQMGAGCSNTLPIYEGKIIYHAAERVSVGGNDVTENLQRLLRGKGYSLTTSAEFEVIRDIKEKLFEIMNKHLLMQSILAFTKKVMNFLMGTQLLWEMNVLEQLKLFSNLNFMELKQ